VVFVDIFFISFRLKEFNLFAHRVSNCVPFFVENKKKHRQWQRNGAQSSKRRTEDSFLDFLKLVQWNSRNSFLTLVAPRTEQTKTSLKFNHSSSCFIIIVVPCV
jgi:hypothetical protein